MRGRPSERLRYTLRPNARTRARRRWRARLGKHRLVEHRPLRIRSRDARARSLAARGPHRARARRSSGHPALRRSGGRLPTDLLWFRSLGLEDVYLRRYTAGFWAFLAFSGLFFALALPNLYFALRPQVPRVVVDTERRRRGAVGSTLRYMWLLLIPAFFFGIAGGDQWDPLLRWLNAVPFGVSDPVFGRDVGFYFFTLPVLDFVRSWAIAAVLVIAAGVVLIYVLRGVIGVATDSISRGDIAVAGRTALALARPARAHLSVLGGLFLLLIAFGYVIDQWDLLIRQDTVLTGAAYTSINARLPALTVLAFIVGIAALACFANAFARTIWVLGGAICPWLPARVSVSGVDPGLIQNFAVGP